MTAALHEERHGGVREDRRPRLLAGTVMAISLLPTAIPAATFELRLRQVDGTALEGAVFSAVPGEVARLATPRPQVMDQHNLRFVPHILPVQAGAQVEFPNSDTVGHHVYSFSAAKRFQLYLATGDAPKTETFERPGEVALGCNIHDWMLAYILVLETPYFTQTDAEGQAVLTQLPAGDYRLQIWHPRIADEGRRLRREATVDQDGEERWDLLLQRPLLPSRHQRPGFTEY